MERSAEHGSRGPSERTCKARVRWLAGKRSQIRIWMRPLTADLPGALWRYCCLRSPIRSAGRSTDLTQPCGSCWYCDLALNPVQEHGLSCDEPGKKACYPIRGNGTCWYAARFSSRRLGLLVRSECTGNCLYVLWKRGELRARVQTTASKPAVHKAKRRHVCLGRRRTHIHRLRLRNLCHQVTILVSVSAQQRGALRC